MHLHRAELAAQVGPFARRLLHIILAKQAVAFLQHRNHPVQGLHLGHRDQAHGTGLAASGGFGVDAEAWFALITDKISLLKESEDRLYQQLSERVARMVALLEKAAGP